MTPTTTYPPPVASSLPEYMGSRPRRVLLADDNLHELEGLAELLGDMGLEVMAKRSGRSTLMAIESQSFDVVVLDWVFAGEEIDGLHVLRRLRIRQPRCMVLLLTGKGALYDKHRAFNLGADDYVIKPFEANEVALRIEALLRRLHITEDAPQEDIHVGDLTLCPDRRQILLDAKPMDLKPKEYALLAYFIRQADRTVSRSEILERVWHDLEANTMSNTIDVHIARIRKHLKPSAVQLKTQHGTGYILISPEQAAKDDE